MKFKDDNVMYVADGLNSIYLYDRRIGDVQGTWFDPFDTSFCCLDHDGLHAILAGSKLQHVCLFDDRSPGKCVQVSLIHTYHGQISKLHRRKSPISGIVCDSRYAFISSDSEVQVLDFKTSKGMFSDNTMFSL